MQILNELSQLLFPTRCYGCSILGPSICSTCRAQWHPHFYKSNLQSLNVYSSLIYSPVASKIILAAKENGLQGADELIIQAIILVLSRTNIKAENLRLVPIPSSKQSQRKRGRSFMVDITQEVSLRTGIPMENCLQLSRKVRDQSGLNRIQRNVNMVGAFSLKDSARGDLVLIDDVVTTGATLKEAARVLNSQGIHALSSLSAVTACVAQPLR